MQNAINYSIRPVKPKDLDQLFDMLVDLVKHEGSYDRFKLTRIRLEDELFGKNADWNGLVAINNDTQLMGFCLYTFANINRAFNLTPMIQIDDLYIIYVSQLYRRTKIGHNLLKQVASIAKTKNIGRLNAWCFKNNEMGQNFYKKVGAEKRDCIDVYSIQVDALLN